MLLAPSLPLPVSTENRKERSEPEWEKHKSGCFGAELERTATPPGLSIRKRGHGNSPIAELPCHSTPRFYK